MSLILVLVMLLMMAGGVGVGVSMGWGGIVALLSNNLSMTILPQKILSGVQSFPLLAVPFFILAGSLMNATGVSDRLFGFAQAAVGHVIGGLAHVNILASLIMSGMSGSAVADTSGLGKIEIPAMVRRGYSPGFSAAVTAASSTIGPIFPPSIGLVIYGAIAEVSIGRLFLGGMLPGVLMAVSMMVSSYVVAKRRGYPTEESFSFQRLGKSFLKSFPVLLTPVLMIGGIISGAFTPTEAAVATCVYVLFLGFFYKTLTRKLILDSLHETLITTGGVLFIVAACGVVSWILTADRFPQTALNFFLQFTNNRLVFLLIVNFFFLILGMFVDPVPLIIILTPVLLPIIKVFGIDPVHFGLIMMVNFMIGLITPPVGMAMYIASSIAEIDIRTFIRECVPMYCALIITLLLITYFPSFVLWIPNLLMGAVL